jgi:hypothetical protein
MDLQTRKRLYNQCKADEPLEPADPRCVDIDGQGEQLRGQAWAERLAQQFQLSDTPVRILFSGLSGSGKSTELKRLRAVLQREQPNLRVVLVDADVRLDLGVPIEAADVLTIILDEVDRDLSSIEGGPSGSVMERFWEFLRSIRPGEASVESPLGSVALARQPEGGSELEAKVGYQGFALGGKLRTDPGIRGWLRAKVAAQPGTFFEQVKELGQVLVERAHKSDLEGIVVLVDSLEKLRGTNESWDQVNESAVRLFDQGAPFLDLPFHVLYTVPPTLKARIRDIEFLPAVRIRERSGAFNPPGVAALREIVRRRIPDPQLGELLGTGCEACLDRIFKLSGGYPRELVRILRELVAVRELPVSSDDFERILSDVRTGYRDLVPEEAFDWLARVEQAKYLTHRDDEEIELVARMLGAEVVLCYHNHEEWWALHPAVAQIPGVRSALDAGKGAEG